MTPLVIRNVTTPGTWFVQCVLIGNPSQSRAGGSSASASSGMGGWQVVDRSRQKAATEWLDYYPIAMSFSCLLDAGPGLNPGSVEGWISTLESFEEPVPGSTPPEPPILTVDGPVPHTDKFWVCTRLEFPAGTGSAIRNTSGTRIQQKFMIELTEYSPSSVVSEVLSPAQAAQINTGTQASLGLVSAVGSYVTVPGDTLQSVAAVQLGKATLWVQIAILNSLSPSAILVPGTYLLLPAV